MFAQILILPWEDKQEFDKLHAALVTEWKPAGPTEEDAVFSIAKGMWRKRRMQLFLKYEMLRCQVNPGHAAYDEAYALRVFLHGMAAQPDQFDVLIRALSAENATHLRRKFPQGDFQSPSEWARAIQNEVTSVLLPAVENSTEVLICRDAAFFTPKVVSDELGIDDRIDAMIDRAIKRLVQAKAMKRMLGTISPNGGSDQYKKLPSNKAAKVITTNQTRQSDKS